MILFISNHGESLPIAWRLLREGVDCGVYVHDPAYRDTYRGILEKISLVDLKAAVKASDTVVFDGIRENGGSLMDAAFLKIFGFPDNSQGVFGPVASLLSKTHRVIGCSSSTERVQLEELDRTEHHGLVHEGWWDGQQWAFFAEIIEDRALMNADFGMKLSCQQSTARILEEMPDGFKDIGAELKGCGYIGPAACDHLGNVIALHPRFDSVFGLLELWQGPSLGAFFQGFAGGRWGVGYAATERISVPPYPYRQQQLLDLARDVCIEGGMYDYPAIWFQDVCVNGKGFQCAGSDGVIGIATGRGKNINAAWAKCYKAIDTLRLSGEIQIRTDGPRKAEKTLKRVRKEA